MTITTSEFQQRVGYYLDLATKGEQVEIVKKKPKPAVYFKLSLQEEPARGNQLTSIMKDLEDHSIAKGEFKSGLVLQKSIRD